MFSQAALTAAFTALSPFWGQLLPGSYDVGFEKVELRDYSRPYAADESDSGRPVALSIWYPSREAETTGTATRFRDYLPPDGRDPFVVRLNASGRRVSSADVETLLDTPTAAYEGAARAGGSFPLLVFGTGLVAPAYLNTVLNEYLASHGFVTVALPSLPDREGASREYDQRAVDTQIRDMEFAIHSLHDYPDVDATRLGLVAWSLGGVSQALLQMKNPNVRAVVSLDAATGYDYGWGLLKESIFFDPSAASAAFFHATESRESAEGVAKSFAYFDDVVRGDAYLLAIRGASHGEFTSFGGMVPSAVLSPEDEGSAEVMRRYSLLCLYVRHFLAKTFHADEEATDFLSVTPSRHGFDGLVLSHKR